MISTNVVNVVGCGLAGIETALFLAGHGVKVHVFDAGKTYEENQIEENTDAGDLYESLLMKELCLLGSPLARKRQELLDKGETDIDEKLIKYGLSLVKNHKNINFFNTIVSEINPFETTIIATGPQTDGKMFEYLTSRYGTMKCVGGLPIFPIFKKVFDALFYQQDNGDYVVSLTEQEYYNFVEIIGREAMEEKRDNEDFKILPNTMEELALHYRDNLRAYAMMPQRVFDGLKPYATMLFKLTDYGLELANFSSSLPLARQERIFHSLTALKEAEIVKPAGIKKGCYVNPINIASRFFQSIQDKNVFFAGGLMGIEGTANVIASGMWCAMNVYKFVEKKKMVPMSTDTMFGKLVNKLTQENTTKTRPLITNNDFIEFDSKMSARRQYDVKLEISMKGLERFKEDYKNGKYV